MSPVTAMRTLVLLFSLMLGVGLQAQTVHDYISLDYSPTERKIGVFSTVDGPTYIDLKVVNMSARDKDLMTFFATLQDLEGKGWEVQASHIYAVESRGYPMYVWVLRRPKR
jgi:hypothetical protein